MYIYGTSPALPALTPVNTMPANTSRRRFKGSRLERSAIIREMKKLCEASRRVDIRNGSSYSVNFYASDSEAAIATVGTLSPLLRGKPRFWTRVLLESIKSPEPARSMSHSMIMHRALIAGLVYQVPLIAGKERVKYRLTATGLTLMDYWAAKKKGFAPFLDAYCDRKSREQINSDCGMMGFGIMPEWLEERFRKHDKAVADIARSKASKLAKDAQMQMRQAPSYTPNTTNVFWDDPYPTTLINSSLLIGMGKWTGTK